jgi:hypothetical protein
MSLCNGDQLAHHTRAALAAAADAGGSSFIRALAVQAVQHPAVRGAVLAAGHGGAGEALIGAMQDTLPRVIEGLLQQAYGGSTLRLYVRSRASDEDRAARDQRIRAAASAGTALAIIAKHEGLNLRTVQRVVRQQLAATSSA